MSEEKNNNQEAVNQEVIGHETIDIDPKTIYKLTKVYTEGEVKHKEMQRISDTLEFNILSLSGTADSLAEKLDNSETIIQTILDKM